MRREWPTRPLGDIAKASSRPMPASDALVWNLSLEDIEPHTGRILARQICRVDALGSSKCVFGTEHVLYSKLRPYLNKVVVPDDTGVGTSELIPLVPDPVVLDRQFLAFYLRSDRFVDFAERMTRGGNLPRISMSDFWKHPIPTPPLTEQRRVSAFVADALARLDEVRRLTIASQLEAKGVWPSMLAGYFSDLAKHEAVMPLASLVVESRYGSSKKCGASGETPVLRIPNIQNGTVSYQNLKYCDLSPDELDELALRRGDMLLVRTNGSPELVGRCAVFGHAEVPTAFASYLIRLRFDLTRVEPEFVSLYLSSTSGRDSISAHRKTSAGQYNVNATNLLKIEVPLPALSDQRRVVMEMHQKRGLVAEVQSTIEHRAVECADLQRGILRRAFEGDF